MFDLLKQQRKNKLSTTAINFATFHESGFYNYR